MNKIVLENNEWEVLENYKDGFDEEMIKSKYTDYFEPYDYIIGDWSYGKLRLKGFCDKINFLKVKYNFTFKKEKKPSLWSKKQTLRGI